jgi:acyl carrier protein
MSTEDKLLTIVSDVLEIDRSAAHMDLSAEDVESWDSLQQLNLVSAVESAFGVTIPIEDLGSIGSVRDFMRYIEGGGA